MKGAMRFACVMEIVVRSACATAILVAGCGDSENSDNTKQAGAGSGGTGSMDANGGSAGLAGSGGSGGDPSQPSVATGTRVFSGTATMLFDGPSCTSENGATTERWCAFIGISSANMRNLFVVNVSRVIAGTSVTCGTDDPNCLLLTAMVGGDNFDPTWHGTFFQGDSLVYYDGTWAPYVWRPGMSRGRLLMNVSSELDAIFCLPATQGTSVACLGYPSAQPDPNLARAELLAGKADGEIEPLLSPIDDVIAGNDADQGGIARFGYGFPAIPGDHIAWTTRATADGPEILKLQTVGSPETKAIVASDVHAWEVSRDGTRWFWQRGTDAKGVGTLQTAAFPEGANPIDIQAGVVEYGLVPNSSNSVVTRSADTTLTGILDAVAAPSEQVVLDTGVQGLLSFSDKGHIAYAKHFLGSNLVDLYVNDLKAAACPIETTTSVPLSSVRFAPNGEGLLWAQRKSGNVPSFDGLHTSLSDCSHSPLASDVAVLAWLDDTIVFMDNFDEDNGTGSMRFRNTSSSEPTLIANHVASYAISSASALLYTVNAGTEADGVYIRSR
ncbi:MAG: hypothetical protein ACOY0T_07395 [Myxococcota bacterium]